jgi:beta-glucosidase
MYHFFSFFSLYFLLSVPQFLLPREIKWDWSSINTTNIWFPKQFLWGCSDSAFQTEGVETAHGKAIENSWTEYEKRKNKLVRVGKSCERWTRFKEDFKLLKSLDMTAYRFSVDWSKIEPQEGVFDEAAMQHYKEVVDELLSLKIKPIITLFHHVCPLWFMQKDGFEKEENIIYFVEFARYVFNNLHHNIEMWIIFNEPVAYAFEGYFRGRYPPEKRDFALTGKVILNLLNAHVATTKELKKIDPNVKIGIAHMCHPVDAYTKWNPFEQMVTKTFSHLMNETTIKFFKKGTFTWIPPWIRGNNPDAIKSLDFFGINYYTHTTIKQMNLFKMEACARPDEKVIDDCGDSERIKVMYPEGLYRSIVKASKLKIPLYITENGVATEDVDIKEEYIKKHLYVISKAIAEGYDIRGYLFWTLMDCFSWNKGYSNKHGIYAVNFETQERIFRPSVSYLIDTIRRFS